MNEYSSEKLLNGFLDGELDPIQEERLFERLSMDAELRAELRDHRTVRSMMREYDSTVPVPLGLKAATFGKLGLALPPAAGTAVLQGALIGGAVGFLQRFWLPIVVSMFFSGLTTALVINFYHPESSQSLSTRSNQTARDAAGGNPFTAPDQSSEKKLPQTASSSANAKVPPAVMRSTASGIRNRPIEAHTVAGPAEDPVSVERIGPKGEEQNDFEGIVRVPAVSIPASPYSLDTTVNDLFRTLSYTPVLPPDFSIQYRTFTSGSTPVAQVSPGSDPWFSNMCVGVFYAASPSQRIGVEAGQEAFPQNYDGVEKGKHVNYYQNLLTGWAVATYQYRLPSLNLLGEVTPYIAASAGSTFTVWPLLRGNVGIMYVPERRVSFILGVDASFLAYPFQSKWFTTKKLGVTYGLSVSF